MRIRRYSTLGWFLLQAIGALCLPFVTRDAHGRAGGVVEP